MASTAKLSDAILASATDYAIISTDLSGTVESWNSGAEKLLGWRAADALGSNIDMIFTPEDRARGASAAEMQTARKKGRAEDERWHLRQDGSRFFASGELMPLKTDDGAHVGYVKLLRDRTRAHQTEERLAASEAWLRVEREAHTALIAAQQAIANAAGSIDGSLDAVVRGALGAIPAADGAAFALLMDDELRYRTVGGSLAQLKGLKVKLHGSLTGRCILEARPLISAETHTDARIDQAAWEKIGARSMVVVPVFHQGEAVGVLMAKSGEPKAFSERDAAVAQLLAGALVAGFADQASAAAARALRDSEQRFRATFENAAVGVAHVAPDGAFVLVNRRFCEIFGYTEEELRRLSFKALTHADDLDRNVFELEPMLTGELDAYSTAKRYVRKDGGVVWVKITASCTRTVEGRVDYIIAVIEDISAQKKAEGWLQESRERLARKAQLLELSHDAVITWEPHGRGISYWNRAAEELYGYSHQEAFGQVTHELLKSRLPLPRPEFDALLEREGSWSGELVHTTKDGRQITVDSRHVLLKEQDGRMTVLETNRDVTQRNAAEAALRESEQRYRALTETLEQRIEEEVAERTSAEEQLRQAQKMEAIGQLTGGIAHDFNNLLTGIIGSLEMMQKRASEGRTQDVKRYVDAAVSSANRAAALTHRLLAFARRQPLYPKSVDANELVGSMADLLRRTLSERVQLQISPTEGLWRTLCDPHQLEAAILNLAINARDAMPAGGKLTIEICNAPLDAYAARQRDVRPGDYVCICVTDTGMGMAREVMARAFEPFFTTKPLGQGTGLGLSMIYGFARQSEGYARIYSEVGQGTTVKLYLPRYNGQEVSEPAQQSKAARLPAGDGQVVLVVEDEPSVADLAVEVLKDLGYRPIGAKDGASGLQLVRSLPQLDLLVTDIGLPGLNGPQLAEAARRIRPSLKVLYMTGYAEKATLASGVLEEDAELITKPFPMEALASRVHSLLSA